MHKMLQLEHISLCSGRNISHECSSWNIQPVAKLPSFPRVRMNASGLLCRIGNPAGAFAVPINRAHGDDTEFRCAEMQDVWGRNSCCVFDSDNFSLAVPSPARSGDRSERTHHRPPREQFAAGIRATGRPRPGSRTGYFRKRWLVSNQALVRGKIHRQG